MIQEFRASKTIFPMLCASALLIIASPAIAQDAGECLAPGADSHDTMQAPLYTLDGSEFFEEDLPADLRQTLFELELDHYHKQLEIINAAVLTAYIEQLAQGSGRTSEELAAELLAVGQPDDAAIEQFYEANRSRIAYPLDAVREQIRGMLREQAQRQKRDELLSSLKQHVSLEVGIEKPLAPFVDIATEGYPAKGPAHAPVTIVEFADYQCPHCKSAAGALATLLEQFPDDVRVVFMDFPVNRSGISRTVAKGAVCAQAQGAFWAYHDLAFEGQDTLTHDSPMQMAGALGLDGEAFATCLASNEPESRVAASESEAARLGVNSTPTLFMNGRRLHVHDLGAELRQAVEETLAGRSS